jgi:uncharacterized membrane protein
VNRKQADIGVGVLLVGVLALGVLAAVRFSTMSESAMGGSGPPALMRFMGPLFLSLVVASILGGMYIYVRGRVFEPTSSSEFSSDGMAAERASAAEADQATTDGAVDERGRDRVLDVLPDDERRILEPVIESPGLTQIKVRDRSGFSKSKVSQTVTDLEARGLLYRERQGRTYRLFPADDLDDGD